MYSVYTPEGYDYNRIWLATKGHHLEFEVLACSDIHISLSDDFGLQESGSNNYEIVIGGWSNSR